MFILVSPAGAQEPQPIAAVLEVTYPGVEIQRVDTEAWIPVSAGAVMAFGAGDAVRTDETGQVLLTLDNRATIMILPNTEWRITELTQADERFEFTSFLAIGEIVVQAPGNTFEYFALNTGETSVRTFSEAIIRDGFSDVATYEQLTPIHLIVKNNPTRFTVVLPADGNIGLQGDTAFADLSSNQAAINGQGRGNIELLDVEQFPASPAQIEGEAFGCPGVVRTEGGRDLNARLGPSTGNPLYGQFPDGAEVRVMGVVASGGWYRVQFKSGFGWVQRLAIELTDPMCEFPTLPDDSFDIPTRIINPTEQEIALLEPFYGTPEDDPIFYREEP